MEETGMKDHIKITKDYIELTSPPDYFGLDNSNFKNIYTETIWTVLKKHAEESPDFKIVATRDYDFQTKKFLDYKYLTYKEWIDLIETVGSGLCEIGLKPNDLVLGCYNNRLEWLTTDLALFRQAAGTVPLRSGLDPSYYEEFMLFSEPTIGVINPDKVSHFARICEEVKNKGKKLTIKYFVIFPYLMGPEYGKESLPEEYKKKFNDLGIKTIKWEELIELGKKHPHPQAEQKPENYHTLSFTSATSSSKVKAILQTQQAMLTSAYRDHDFKCEGGGYYSFTNQQHLSEREGINANLSMGKMRIFFPSDGFKNFFDDIEKGHPSELGCPPLILKIFFGTTKELISSGIPEEEANAIMRKKLGGIFQFMCAYGTASSRDLLDWGIKALNVKVNNVYGATESAGSATHTKFSQVLPKANSIGVPTYLTTVRLIDAPEFGCKITNNPPSGEVLIKNPGCHGYYKNDELTKKYFDKDGFYHSSDLAQLEEDGTLTLIGRTCSVIKTASAGFVPLETIEDYLLTSPMISTNFVYGDIEDDNLVGVIVPNFAAVAVNPKLPSELKDACLKAKANPNSENAKKLCKNPKLEQLFLDEIKAIAVKNHFRAQWNIQGVVLDPVMWTEENGLITYSKKLKRYSILDHFKPQILAKKEELRKIYKIEKSARLVE